MEKRNRMPCPLNEFTEHCTGDMPLLDNYNHQNGGKTMENQQPLSEPDLVMKELDALQLLLFELQRNLAAIGIVYQEGARQNGELTKLTTSFYTGLIHIGRRLRRVEELITGGTYENQGRS